MSDLKRCPFCGGEAKICGYYFIQCVKCGSSTLTHTNRESAINTWNTRFPTVEAKPVVHGEWIDTCPEYHIGTRSNAYKCSNCGDYYTTEPEELFFCPRCGADMRGEKHD